MLSTSYIYLYSEKVAALGLPQLAVTFLADSSWNVNGTQTSELLGRYSRTLSQLASDKCS